MWNETMIRSFLILGKTSSFTKAAEQTHFTQQAISGHILRLEEALGCELVVRERNNVHLTKAGEIYFHAFKTAFEQIDSAKEAVTQLQSQQKTYLRIGHLSMLPVSNFWCGFIEKFQKLYPNIIIQSVSCEGSSLLSELQRGSIDGFIAFYDENTMGGSRFEHITLEPPAREIICIHQNYPGAKEISCWRDFLNITFLLPTYSADFQRNQLTELGFSNEHVEYNNSFAEAVNKVNLLRGAIFLNDRTGGRISAEWLAFETPLYSQEIALTWKRSGKSLALRVMLDYLRLILADWGNEKGSVEEDHP